MSATPKDTYLEVSVSGSANHETRLAQAHQFLLDQRIKPDTIASFQEKNRFRLSVYFKERKRVKSLLNAFEQAETPGLRMNWRELGREDWRDKWMLDYQTQPMGKTLMLVPIWNKEKFAHMKRLPIFLEPKAAFGAGTHESTKMMVKLMEECQGKFEDYLDLGTGTGILSVAASRLGAKKIKGMDHDRDSVKTAKINMKHNGIAKASFFAADLYNLRKNWQYDLVGANLFTNVLIDNKAKIFSYVRPGKYLLASGVARKHEREFREKFRSPKFRCLRILRGRKWMGFLFKRRA